MATTLCPTCGERVEHPPHWLITIERDRAAEGARTRLIANRTLVIHTCTAADDDEP